MGASGSIFPFLERLTDWKSIAPTTVFILRTNFNSHLFVPMEVCEYCEHQTLGFALDGLAQTLTDCDVDIAPGENIIISSNLNLQVMSHLNFFFEKASRPTKILVHGFNDYGRCGWVRDVRDKYLQTGTLI